jgi:hypothetical protein
MTNLLQVLRTKQAEIRDGFRANAEGIDKAIIIIREIQADLEATGASGEARERLESILLELPQTRGLFRGLADGGLKLNPDNHPTPAEVAQAIRMVLNMFLQAHPASDEDVAFALLQDAPTAQPNEETETQ